MTELDYDERAADFNTTNTTLFATTGIGGANPIVGGLSVTFTGTGDPVEVEFYAPGTKHTASAPVTTYFVVNGAVAAATSQYRIWGSSLVEGGVMRRRFVGAVGTSYTVQVGVTGFSAGIATVCGQLVVGPAAAGVMHLRVTG